MPFNELVERSMNGKATDEEKGELRKLVNAMRSRRLPGRWFEEVRVATSPDGVNFTDTRQTVRRMASVPEAVADAEGNLWLFYVDTVDLRELAVVRRSRTPGPPAASVGAGAQRVEAPRNGK